MAKRSGLGKGLDSLIPDFYNEDFDSNSSISLEDMIDETPKEITNEEETNKKEDIKIKETKEEIKEEEIPKVKKEKKSLTEKEIENIKEVKEVVAKNPRITLWSSQSACVFRYLRKTEPEFSISKEASILIDEAVSKKYPEIWEMFED